MFIRFRQRGASLYVILAESRRVNGVVRQQHVASLGVVRLNADAEKWATTRERSAVWLELHEIIGKLQIDGELAAKLMAALQARLPYPTQEEIGAVELAKAEDDAQFWETFHGGMQEQIGLHQKLIDKAQQKIAELEKAAKNGQENADTARGKVVRFANYRGA